MFMLSLQTCKSLYDFSTTRPVYRKFASDLLRRCRALPLKGFQRLTDLTTEQLIRSVNKAAHYESAWRHRGPRPIRTGPYMGINMYSNYMDMVDNTELGTRPDNWYKVVSAPPDEDVDWLSPITSSYTLCATKSGKVVCWDVQTNCCLAEWNPGERWELWKCRVEFEEKTVFFTMAKIVVGSYDDARVMEFVLMRLKFSDSPSGESSSPPVFSHVTDFRTAGVVMNVFLLDPSAQLLSAFVWVAGSNTIGLYVLLNWDEKEYVFIDTGIECVASSNWSCILYERSIVIHCEESEGAYQYFYPLHLLRPYKKCLVSEIDIPIISYAVSPAKTISRKFIFPALTEPSAEIVEPPIMVDSDNFAENAPPPLIMPNASTSTNALNGHQPQPHSQPQPNPNPFPFPPWCPDSAHFVRQWWPSLPGIPRISCTVVLLSAHDPDTHRTRFILAQHYFRVPLSHSRWDQDDIVAPLRHQLVGAAHTLRESQDTDEQDTDTSTTDQSSISGSTHETLDEEQDEIKGTEEAHDDAMMHLWYVTTPFEVVCVMDGTEDEEDLMADRPRPLVAVDFGHAVWIEFVENEDDLGPRPEGDSDAKWLRFVTFPPFSEDGQDSMALNADGTPRVGMGGEVRTLEIPDELDLDCVETINIDQSQGAIILSVRDGKIFILCYE
ncbi:hypothetical protein BDZ94DRAFT_1254710 [Collybia nuda]|uniref:Uncharacterized protein n=1 Tax=Collybia nuda TaxID=64659 RepID=A0A9P6CLR5_9AGAR|nr:hypothetical protein BDZ94DRAFT_1254710 [Collybia nuda]